MPAVIIILEGLNGSGKTAYAKLLSEALDIQVYRPFRGDALDGHNFYPDLERMKKLGVPVNQYHEDIYVSDVLRAMPAKVILDRSMPSAILYGKLNGYLPDDKGDVDFLFDLWQGNLQQAGAYVVWLECEYGLANERCSHKKIPLNFAQFRKLSNLSQIIFTRIKFNKIKINTGIVTIEDGIKRVIDWIGN